VTIYNKNAYSVALTFPGEMEIFLSKLREPFRPHMFHAFIPHITLVYAFQPAKNIESLVAQLERAAAKAKPFTLTLEGIEFFQTINNVAYIAIKNPEPVKALLDDIVREIRGEVTGYYAGDEYHPDHLIPHMTIGEKIPAHIFPGVKKRFAEIEVRREIEVTNFVLAGESGGLWETLKTFKMGGNKPSS
jgi:2'-5' RNA ligase